MGEARIQATQGERQEGQASEERLQEKHYGS